MRRRTLPALIAALLASGAAVHAQPEAGGAPADEQAGAPTVFFAMQIADEQGSVLAEPKLLGMCGVPLEMRLSEPGMVSEPWMNLVLQPESRQDGSFDVAFELSIPGTVDKGKGSMHLRSGEEKSAWLPYPGGQVEVLVAAFAVPSAEFDLFLEHGLRRPDTPCRT